MKHYCADCGWLRESDWCAGCHLRHAPPLPRRKRSLCDSAVASDSTCATVDGSTIVTYPEHRSA